MKDIGPKSTECPHGVFHFKPQKNEKAVRAVPVHSALAKIVRRRVAGKAPSDDLFPEWPAPKKAGTERERSFKASNAFTEYRRSIGVEEMVAGKPRSLVNFHSFRRWFITEAERAGQPESIIAAVVGHRRPGMTLGLYSAGPALKQARACVEAVKLPRAIGEETELARQIPPQSLSASLESPLQDNRERAAMSNSVRTRRRLPGYCPTFCIRAPIVPWVQAP